MNFIDYIVKDENLDETDERLKIKLTKLLKKELQDIKKIVDQKLKADNNASVDELRDQNSKAQTALSLLN